jgi:hypothetical protein
MTKPSRLKVEISFEDPGQHPGWTAELREFITEALETNGGSRHPDDWLFHSLSNVRVGFIRKEPGA